MLNLIVGSAVQIFEKMNVLIQPATKKANETEDDLLQANKQQVMKDEERRYFLGYPSQFEADRKIWSELNKEQTLTYVQGTRDARNVYLALLGLYVFLDRESHDDPNALETWRHNLQELQYAFLDDEGVSCGLSLKFMANEPTRFIFSLIKHTNEIPEKREVWNLTSEMPDDFGIGVKNSRRASISSQADAREIFLNQIKSPLVELFFKTALPAGREEIDSKCKVFDLIAQRADADFKDNTLINHYLLAGQTVSTSSSSNATSNDSQSQTNLLLFKLAKEGILTAQAFGEYYPLASHMLLEGIHNKWISLDDMVNLQNQMEADPVFANSVVRIFQKNKSVGQVVNLAKLSGDERIAAKLQFAYGVRVPNESCLRALDQLDRFLQSAQYGDNAHTYICSALERVVGYYENNTSLNDIIDALLSGLDSQDTPDSIGHLAPELTKKIFEIVRGLPDEEDDDAHHYNDSCFIEHALPVLNGQFKSGITDTFSMLIYKEIWQFGLSIADQQVLNEEQINNAIQAMIVSRRQNFGSDQISLQTLLGNQVLCTLILNTSDRDCLQKLLALSNEAAVLNFLRINSEPEKKDILIAAFCSDKLTNKKVNESTFYSKLARVKKLLDLNLEPNIIGLLLGNDDISRRFGEVVRIVLNETGKIHRHLVNAAPTSRKLREFESHLPNYCKRIFEAAYAELTRDPAIISHSKGQSNLRANIFNAELGMKIALKQDRNKFVRRCMQIIANGVTLLCTLTIANWYHKYQTGDFFFFNRPKSSEALRVLNKKLFTELTPVAP